MPSQAVRSLHSEDQSSVSHAQRPQGPDLNHLFSFISFCSWQVRFQLFQTHHTPNPPQLPPLRLGSAISFPIVLFHHPCVLKFFLLLQTSSISSCPTPKLHSTEVPFEVLWVSTPRHGGMQWYPVYSLQPDSQVLILVPALAVSAWEQSRTLCASVSLYSMHADDDDNIYLVQ